MTTPPVGSAAEEAARLFAAVEDWVRTRGGGALLDGAFDREHLATGDTPCTVCPVCQGISLLRQVKPETVEHLIDAAASVVAALKSAAATPSPPSGDEAPRAARVERIDVQEG